MCGKALMVLQIITCAFVYGAESQKVYEYPQNIHRDSVQRNLNLELLKIKHQIPVGRDIELYCGTTDSELVTSSQSPTFWHFKHCGHRSSCSKAIESRDHRSWQKLQCSTNNCGSSLKITNTTAKDSGLYRCSIYPSSQSSSEKEFVKTYFLDVRNSTTITSPVIVDGPKNTTTLSDSQVVFQCFVNSTIRPSITWFKRHEAPLTSFNETTNLIEYSDIHGVSHYYAPLESAERVLNDGMFLSKLILPSVTEQDAGFYGCVAMNYGGYKIQEAHLTVLDALADESNQHEPDIRSLFLLFLIPVGLALAPLTLWICYVVFKRQRIKHGDHKIDTNGNDYVQVNRIIVL